MHLFLIVSVYWGLRELVVNPVNLFIQLIGASGKLGYLCIVSLLWLFGTSFGIDLTFFKLFKLYFHLGLITTPMFSMFTWLMFIPIIMLTRSHGQEKSLLYYDLFNFGVLLYRCTPTLIFFLFLHNPTTPILPIYVNQWRAHLEKNTTRLSGVIQRKVSTVPRQTFLGPD